MTAEVTDGLGGAATLALTGTKAGIRGNKEWCGRIVQRRWRFIPVSVTAGGNAPFSSRVNNPAQACRVTCTREFTVTVFMQITSIAGPNLDEGRKLKERGIDPNNPVPGTRAATGPEINTVMEVLSRTPHAGCGRAGQGRGRERHRTQRLHPVPPVADRSGSGTGQAAGRHLARRRRAGWRAHRGRRAAGRRRAIRLAERRHRRDQGRQAGGEHSAQLHGLLSRRGGHSVPC